MIFYTFLVVMFLMRPFFSYQLSANGTFLNEHARLMSMFQRVVKKKETHIEDSNECDEIIRAIDVEIVLPFVLLILLRRQAGWLLSLLSASTIDWRRNTIFQVSPSNQYFQLISRLQI